MAQQQKLEAFVFELFFLLDDIFHISVVEPVITLCFPLELFDTYKGRVGT